MRRSREPSMLATPSRTPLTRWRMKSALLLGLLIASASFAADLPDLALHAAQVITEPGPNHVKSSRGAQGVPAIERTTKGRLWAAWYAGKSKRGVESSSSYVVLATSRDDGAKWTEKLVLQAPRLCHTYDPCLWIDPAEKLGLFWAQSLHWSAGFHSSGGRRDGTGVRPLLFRSFSSSSRSVRVLGS